MRNGPAAYIAEVFAQLGLEPAGDERSGGTRDGADERGWFEHFEFPAGVSLGENNRLRLDGEPVGRVDEDWRPLSFSAQRRVRRASRRIRGIRPRPAGERRVRGVRLVRRTRRRGQVGRGAPLRARGRSGGAAQPARAFSALRYKAVVARDRGAAGLLVVTDRVPRCAIPWSPCAVMPLSPA